MNRAKLKPFVTAAILSIVATEAGAQAIYTGDCARANALLAAKPARDYFQSSYVGSGRRAFEDTCGRTTWMAFTLTLRTTAGASVVFDVTRRAVRAFNTTGTCTDPFLSTSNIVGTLTIDLKVQNEAGVCSLVMSGAYSLRDTTNPEWSSNVTQVIVPIGAAGTYFVAVGGSNQITAFNAN